MTEAILPFYIGQVVEARSFETGYRGAWFRCKIKDMWRHGLFHKLEYLDFPDEELHQTKVFQRHRGKNLRGKEHLMVRPEFPPVYRESEVPDVNGVVEAVVVKDSWNLGDLVDWWSDNCYWSGRIIKVLKNEKFEIQLFPEPFGEGGCYEVSSNDLRPSLDYSPDSGWTVPFSKNGEKGQRCARLIKPVNEGNVDNLSDDTLEKSELKIQPKAQAPANEKASPSPQNSPVRTATKSQCNSDVSDCGRDEKEEEEEEEEEDTTGGASKKPKTEGQILLNTMVSSTIEAAVVDLEELISRIKWLKHMLKCFPEAVASSWAFEDYRESTSRRT